MLYLDDVPHVEVGVLDTKQCSPSGRVVRSALPSGRVVTTVHQGPYSGLGDAHEAIHAWCADAGIRLGRVRWEVYGPHRDDPAELRTEITWMVENV